MSIVNRRNAILGWGFWKITKSFFRYKAKSAAPAVEGGRPNKSLLAVALAGAVGALTFWRKHSSRSSESA